MSIPTIVRKMTYSDWLQVGKDLYGDDKMSWEFSCPNCKRVLSFEKFIERKKDLKDWQPYSECAGRYLSGIDCDWAAYGLFCGPREIVENDGITHKSYVFYFVKEVEQP